jgi:hypothetical protein
MATDNRAKEKEVGEKESVTERAQPGVTVRLVTLTDGMLAREIKDKL